MPPTQRTRAALMPSVTTTIATATNKAIRFLGPVANAVHGEISKAGDRAGRSRKPWSSAR